MSTSVPIQQDNKAAHVKMTAHTAIRCIMHSKLRGSYSQNEACSSDVGLEEKDGVGWGGFLPASAI